MRTQIKVISSAIFLTIIILSCKSSPDEKKPTHVLAIGSNDLKEMGLRGKVKEVEFKGVGSEYDETYFFDSLGFLFEKQSWSNRKEAKIIYFHENNKLVWEKHTYDTETSDSTFYFRDNNDNLVEEIEYFFKIHGIDSSEKYFFYDGHKDFKKSILIGSNKDTFSIQEHFFDKNGKVIKRVSTGPPNKNSPQALVNIMYYDSDGNSKVDSIYYGGKWTGLNKFLYDELGNEIESTNSNVAGIPQIIQTTYTYDDFGNWIKSVTVRDTNGHKSESSTIRTITYY